MNGTIVRFFSRQQKPLLTTASHNTRRTQSIQFHSIFLRYYNEHFTMKTSGNADNRAYKGEGKHVHGKMKTWKKRIKTNFRVEDVPYTI